METNDLPLGDVYRLIGELFERLANTTADIAAMKRVQDGDAGHKAAFIEFRKEAMRQTDVVMMMEASVAARSKAQSAQG